MLNPNNPHANIRLTREINRFPSIPQMIGKMGLFTHVPIETRVIGVDVSSNGHYLIPAGPVGGKGLAITEAKAKLELFGCTYHATNFTLNAQEMVAVRALGSEGMDTVPAAINRHLTKARNSHLATFEHLKIGAIKGQILDADGTTVLTNLYTRYGFTQRTTDFTLGTAGTDILSRVVECKQAIEDAAGNIELDEVICLCGRTWFNKFVAHPNVQKAYANWNEAGNRLAKDQRKGFEFGGVTFIVYSGFVGNYKFVADNEGYMFPKGLPDMFEFYHCPPNHVDYVNSGDSPAILVTEKALDHGQGMEYLAQSNPIAMNYRPDLVTKVTTSN